jgi:hypothetical protein
VVSSGNAEGASSFSEALFERGSSRQGTPVERQQAEGQDAEVGQKDQRVPPHDAIGWEHR